MTKFRSVVHEWAVYSKNSMVGTISMYSAPFI